MKASRKEIEQKLAQAVEAETPDCLPDILRRLQPLEGAESEMESTINNSPAVDTAKTAGSRRGIWVKAAACIAAALVLVVGAGAGYAYFTPQAVIGLDVNPSIELKVNRSERVLSAVPLNEDAEVILGEMDLKNVDLDTAVNALVGSMVKNGYISEIKNSILISVDAKDEKKGSALQERLSAEVGETLNAYSVNAAVLSQTVSEDERLKALAEEYRISLGKASLIDQLVSGDGTLRYDELAALSVNDLGLLIEARESELKGVAASGKANSGAYIGEEKAKALALKRADLKESDVSGLRIKLDFENGQMVYEVEFVSGGTEYDVEVGASDGKITKFEQESKNVSQGSGASGDSLTLEEALKLAYMDAGLKAEDVTLLKQKSDIDDGVLVYEIEFFDFIKVYEYEIDGATGNVLKRKQKNLVIDDILDTMKPSEGDIGGEKALQIAMTRAGLTHKSIGLESNKEWEDGQAVYEFHMTCEGKEYKVVVAAADGSVLKYEQKGSAGASSATGGEEVSEKMARIIAISQSGLTDVHIDTRIEREWEDGRAVYKVEYWYDGIKYEVEIAVDSGEVLIFEQEKEPAASSVPASSSGSYIGEDKAKSIALSHAGVSSGNLWGYQCELDSDDGRKYYDIGFHAGNMEYDYDIDAVTGDILSWDSEKENTSSTVSTTGQSRKSTGPDDDDDDYDDDDDGPDDDDDDSDDDLDDGWDGDDD